MSIFSRIRDIAAADVHSTLDRLEDPVSMLNQYLREMEKEIEKAQDALADQLFIERKYAALVSDTEAIISKRIRQAHLAADRGGDDIARLAISEKLAQQKKLDTYREQFLTVKSQTSLLYSQIDKLKDTYAELQGRRLALVSRLNVARTTAEIGKTASNFNPDHAVKRFERMEDQILRIEAETVAAGYFSSKETPKVTGVYNEEVEMELARLKVKKESQPELVEAID